MGESFYPERIKKKKKRYNGPMMKPMGRMHDLGMLNLCTALLKCSDISGENDEKWKWITNPLCRNICEVYNLDFERYEGWLALEDQLYDGSTDELEYEQLRLRDLYAVSTL